MDDDFFFPVFGIILMGVFFCLFFAVLNDMNNDDAEQRQADYKKFESACVSDLHGRVVDTGAKVVCIKNDRVVLTR